MSYPKKTLYSPESQALSLCSIGINYPSRSKILIDLIDGPKTSFELAENQVISRTTLVQHLHRLQAADFVTIDKYKPQPVYLINPKAIPKWIFLALLEHPDADHKKIMDFVPSNYLANLLLRVNASRSRSMIN